MKINKTVIDSKWYGLIGIVKVNAGHEIKWYIGTGLGFDLEMDELTIAERGMPFYPNHMNNFFNPDLHETEDM